MIEKIKTNKFKLIAGILVVLIALFTLKLFNDYRERNLADLINVNSSDFVNMRIVTPEGNMWTEEIQHVDELLQVFNQYQVKRISQNEFQNQHNDKKIYTTFEVRIQKNSGAIILHVFETDFIWLNLNFYKVLNGPIEEERLRTYFENHES